MTEEEFVAHFPIELTSTWDVWLAKFKGQPAHGLEIGSWKGLSALWTMRNILTDPLATLTLVDTFAGGEGLKEYSDDALLKECQHNLSRFGQQVQYRVGSSVHVLPYLVSQGAQFDFVYVDGSHRADNVLRDAVLSWDLCRNGSVIIFDDYGWKPELPIKDRPQAAIDAFLTCFEGKYRLIHKAGQVALEVLK